MIIRYAVKSCQGGRSYNEDTVQVHETAGKRLYVLADWEDRDMAKLHPQRL